MKKKLLLLFAVLATAINASAYSFSAVNNDDVTIYYNIINGTTNVQVVSSGSPYSISVVNIPETVNHNGTDYTVTEIASYAFRGSEKLTSVSIPNTVTTIGELAFHTCSYLSSVTLGSSLKTIEKEAFYYCKELTSIVIPDAVTEIGDEAFSNCTQLNPTLPLM